ncbi:beta-ketoacyl synthase N-terminal-like domain-containing protein [Bacteroidetes bacterium endosymbiont of Geopemphigus sp.]|uniref:beta-ketoacyl synthase N-terminal-like domain-containing protein n=1 Tax=Bacteroidetes bacterium endosymbiont of Geopemphigus sp. TaxID=2047937 RepID=UPI001F4E5627|nr:beta-ketoacyl synthase N-terminal-like domain-containing protein [Bacteroidetes bacterium endosymbiont of Geopemphigus sp.]
MKHIKNLKISKICSITGMGSLSSLGISDEEIINNLHSEKTFIKKIFTGDKQVWAAPLALEAQEYIFSFLSRSSKYKCLDPSVLLSMLAAEKALKQARWGAQKPIGINIGSSRGATHAFESHFSYFSKDLEGKAQILSSPTTTLGNIAYWTGQHLQSTGMAFSHSITCSSALHALLNAVVWLHSGFCEKFIAGGAEAPLTPFTIAQMQALRIYSKKEGPYPCRAGDLKKSGNSFVLGEGAAVFALEKGVKKNALALIENIGFATETLQSHTSISEEGENLQKSMKMALSHSSAEEVDAIVTHTPGTLKGDFAEYRAIQAVFGNSPLLITNNKWKTGHTLGASGALSLEMAVRMLKEDIFIPLPFYGAKTYRKKMRKILVNATGFGGNAVSILLSKNL